MLTTEGERVNTRASNQQFPLRLCVSRQTINSIETGRYVPSTILALKLAQVFGKAVEHIFTLEETD